ncbi:hypothetical protein FACUT_1076 [Fusarium acutatum]|uniref:Uncharacterized protein n=1 Tax=Fusarium acutatum TaxID=78861 RepID=A0A8H4K4X5_9HYPO|nr:hypothetical protein FACUT_1076 [Fusarium acutatum]
MSIFQALRRALTTNGPKTHGTGLPSGHTPVHTTRPFRHVPVIQNHYRGDPQLRKEQDALRLGRDVRDLDLEGDLLVLKRRLRGLGYRNSNVLNQLEAMYGASREARWAFKGMERQPNEERERKKAESLSTIIQVLPESEVSRESLQYSFNMAVSKAVSEQELETKRRHGLQASMVEVKFEERHRRKLEASRFLIKFEGPLDSTEAVSQAAGIPSPDGVAISTTDSSRKVDSFLEINAINKATIEAYLKTNPSLAKFLQLSSHATQQERVFRLTAFDIGVLAELLGDNGRYEKAVIIGGRLNYQEGDWALANRTEGRGSVVSVALQVETQEQEDMLRAYQTDTYEVVRCSIYIMVGYKGEAVPGLTLRLIEKAMD